MTRLDELGRDGMNLSGDLWQSWPERMSSGLSLGGWNRGHVGECARYFRSTYRGFTSSLQEGTSNAQ
jgi:hypothetical protein